MGLIDSGKRAIVTHTITIPAGMNEEQAIGWIANSISLSLAIKDAIVHTHIKIVALEPNGAIGLVT